jgi:hypothetical protein
LSRRKQEIFGSNSDYEIPCTAKTYGGSEAAKTGSLKLGGMRIADAKINFDRRIPKWPLDPTAVAAAGVAAAAA